MSKISPKYAIGVIFAVVMAIIFMGILMPIGMEQFTDANTTGWSDSTKSIWDVLPIFAVLTLLAVLGGWAYKSFT